MAHRRAIWRHDGEAMQVRVRNKVGLSGGELFCLRATISALMAAIIAVWSRSRCVARTW